MFSSCFVLLPGNVTSAILLVLLSVQAMSNAKLLYPLKKLSVTKAQHHKESYYTSAATTDYFYYVFHLK